METDVGFRLAADIRALAAIERPSASPGEEEAARWVRSRLRELGLDAEIEPFHFNPDYWTIWAAHGRIAAAAAGLAFLGRRGARVGFLASTLATASFWGELTREFYLLRRLFPTSTSYNVLARLPNPEASRLIIVSAHHDAPHSGLVFHPAIFETAARLLGPSEEPPPVLRVPFGAMAAVTAAALGRSLGMRGAISRRLLLTGGLLSLTFAALMRNVGRSQLSPGANDDASGVAVLLALAEALVQDPPPDMEVWFLSTGSEEGILGGMEAFMERHRGELHGRRPFVLNFEVLGSGHPVVLEGEGFLRRYPYHPEAVALASEVAAEPEFASVRFLRNAPFATDALIATQRGIPAITVASLNDDGYVPHYHWPTDTPENIDLRSVEEAYAFSYRLIRRLAEGQP